MRRRLVWIVPLVLLATAVGIVTVFWARRDHRLDFIARIGTRVKGLTGPNQASLANPPPDPSSRIRGYVIRGMSPIEVLRLIKKELPAAEFKQTFAAGGPPVGDRYDALDLKNPRLDAEFDWLDARSGTAVQMITGIYVGYLNVDGVREPDVVVFTYEPTTAMGRKVDEMLTAIGLAP